MNTALFLLVGALLFLVGCTNGKPELQSSLSEFDGVSFSGKATEEFNIVTSPNCTSALTIPGECDKRLESVEASFDQETWFAVQDYDGTSDGSCKDGDFSLVLNNACSSLVVGDGETAQKKVYFRGKINDARTLIREAVIAFSPQSPEGPSIAVDDPIAAPEGSSVVFTVTLSTPSTESVSVAYQTSLVTAASADFTATSGTLTFAPGETSKTVEVPVLTDSLYEIATETFYLNLSGAVNGTILGGLGLGKITNTDPAPVFEFASASQIFNESAGTASLNISSTVAADQNMVVTYTVAGTASGGGVDYTLADGTITIPAGATSAVISLPVVDDASMELGPTETVIVTLGIDSAGIGSVGSQASHTLSIVDNESPNLTIADATIDEGGNLDFVITTSVAIGADITVDWATANDTALSGTHYTLISGTATLPAHQTSVTVSVASLDNAAVCETSKILKVDLSNVSLNATIARAQASGVITDPDRPTISIADLSLGENFSGDVVASLSAACISHAITFNWSTAHGTATAVDYATVNSSAQIAAGNTSVNLPVTTLPDTLDEVDETFMVNLSSSINGAIVDGAAQVTIVDDDNVPSVSINSPAAEDEGSSIDFTVSLSEASGKTITVDYANSDVTTTQGSDYPATTGTLTFAPGEITKTITVATVADLIDEVATENFDITLSNENNALLGTDTGVGSINDVDPPPTLSINSPGAENEGQNVEFTVTLSPPSGQTVQVNYNSVDGTASVGDGDFSSVTGTLIFTPGETSKSVIVGLVNDALDEEDVETFTLFLSGSINAGIGTASGTGSLTDTDSLPDLSINSPGAVLEGLAVTFTVSLNTASGRTITVDYQASGVTAGSPGDFTDSPGTLIFAAGETSKDITVTTIGDAAVEPSETFSMTILNAVNAGITSSVGTGTLNDDDLPPAPTGLSLSSPSTSPNTDSTPTVLISGLANGDTVKLFTDSSCTIEVASGSASGTTHALTSSVIAEGAHTFYANRTVGGVTSNCSSAFVAYNYLSLNVLALYSSAPKWNDYIRNDGASVYTAGNIACDGSEGGKYSSCIHGGEKKKVPLPGYTSCSGLAMEDSLGAFDWECILISGTANFVTKGLRADKNLAHLLSGITWASNFVKLYIGGTFVVAGSPSITWWSNGISSLPASTPLSLASQIYVATTNLSSTGNFISADKIALVIPPAFTLSSSGTGTNCNSSTGTNSGVNAKCLVFGGSVKFLWIEGNFDASSAQPQQYGLLLGSVKFSRVRNANFYNARHSGIMLVSSAYNFLTGLRMAYNNSDSTMSGAAINLQTSNHNILSDITVSNTSYGTGTDRGAVNLTASTYNIISRVLSGANYTSGMILQSSSNSNTITGITSFGNGNLTNIGTGLKISFSNNNTIAQGVFFNNEYKGLQLNSCSSTQVAQLFARQNGSNGIEDIAAVNSVYHHGVWVDNCSTSGTNVGLTSGCVTSGGSTATVDPGVALTTSTFIGRISANDLMNSYDTSGSGANSTLDTLAEYVNFDNFFRIWGNDASDILTAAAQGLCELTTCRIWDLRVSSSDTALYNRNGSFVEGVSCPASVHGNKTLIDSDGNTFLVNAMELVGDGKGDDDTLCESSEACVFSPHIGVYQGMGVVNTSQSCIFTNGLVTNVSMYGKYYAMMDGGSTSTPITLSVDALTLTKSSGTGPTSSRANIGKNSGKWYFEVKVVSGGVTTDSTIGFGTASSSLTNYVGSQGTA
ncbi:MAG: Calx-beta domain-containing protein, partial [Pseudobdellovibrionaceae bacterium]